MKPNKISLTIKIVPNKYVLEKINDQKKAYPFDYFLQEIAD